MRIFFFILYINSPGIRILSENQTLRVIKEPIPTFHRALNSNSYMLDVDNKMVLHASFSYFIHQPDTRHNSAFYEDIIIEFSSTNLPKYKTYFISYDQFTFVAEFQSVDARTVIIYIPKQFVRVFYNRFSCSDTAPQYDTEDQTVDTESTNRMRILSS